MSIKNLPGLVVLALLVPAAPVSGRFGSPKLLFDAPTADVFPVGTVAISADMTLPLTNSPANLGYAEADANVRFSPVRRLDFAVTAYTPRDYVVDAKYQLVGDGPDRFGLAVGVLDVGIHNHVSPIGNGLDVAWPDWLYQNNRKWYTRPYENLSAFAVASIPLGRFARLHLGLGRGRFVGYDGPNEYVNTDALFGDEFHQWAVGLFGGAEVFVTPPNVALVAEANSRDIGTGAKALFGPVTVAVAWTKMEGLLWADEKRRFGRLEFGATYKFETCARQRVTEAPIWPQELPPPPETTQPIAEERRLYPIWFMWDKWDITEAAAAALRRNADVILSHSDIKMVTILGHASEEGTLEHNLPLSGRRANAAFEYLKSLGVPAGRMVTKAMGESAGRPLPMHRVAHFEIELERQGAETGTGKRTSEE